MANDHLKSIVRAFLETHSKAVIAVAGTDGKPKASLVLFAIEDDLTIYIGTRRSSGKYTAMRANPNVSMVVLEGSVDPLRSVEIQGKAEEVPAGESAALLKRFEEKNEAAFYVKGADDFVMFRITPFDIKWLDATSGELKIQELKIGDRL